MNDDLISRQDAIDLVSQYTFYDDYDDTDKFCLIDGLKNLPSAQPEQKMGKWIITKTERSWNCGEYPIEVTCSNCGYIEDYYKKNNFCPCCGADMRGEKDE